MWEITLNSTNCIVSTDLFVFNSFRADADRFVRVLKNVFIVGADFSCQQSNHVTLQCVRRHRANGLDVTDKLLCCFVMALGNDGITHLTIKSYLSAVHWPGSRIQRVPRSCGTSKETRPLCLLLGGIVRLGGAISTHPQTWCYNAYHDPWSNANDR